jgi:hypothetical protein
MTDSHGTISNAFLKLSDLSLMLVSLSLVIVYRYSPGENVGFLFSYLSERVKVGNAILGFMLILFWHAAFAAQGLYVSHRLTMTEIREVVRAVLVTAIRFGGGPIGKWPTINVTTVASFAALSFILSHHATGVEIKFGCALVVTTSSSLDRWRWRQGARPRSVIIKRQDPGYALLGLWTMKC